MNGGGGGGFVSHFQSGSLITTTEAKDSRTRYDFIWELGRTSG